MLLKCTHQTTSYIFFNIIKANNAITGTLPPTLGDLKEIRFLSLGKYVSCRRIFFRTLLSWENLTKSNSPYGVISQWCLQVPFWHYSLGHSTVFVHQYTFQLLLKLVNGLKKRKMYILRGMVAIVYLEIFEYFSILRIFLESFLRFF